MNIGNLKVGIESFDFCFKLRADMLFSNRGDKVSMYHFKEIVFFVGADVPPLRANHNFPKLPKISKWQIWGANILLNVALFQQLYS